MSDNTAASLDEITHKRQAVYTSLKPFFSEKGLMDVMWLWEEGYASGQDQSMRKFINEIFQGQNRSMANSAYHSLMSHLEDPKIKLEEDPYSLMLAYRSGKLSFATTGPSKLAKLTEPMVVFNNLLDTYLHLLDQIDNYYAFKVREYVSMQVGVHNDVFDIQQINELSIWMKYRENQLEYPYNIEQMSLVLHLIYIGSCEFFGPAKSDHCLADAVSAVEKTPEGRKFPPKQLL